MVLAVMALPWQIVVGIKGSRAALLVIKGFLISSSSIEDRLTWLLAMAKFSAVVQARPLVALVARVPQKSMVVLLRARFRFRMVSRLVCRFRSLVPPSRVVGKSLSRVAILQFSSPRVVA